MKRNSYTLFYSAILGVVCALIPTAMGQYTKPFREANEKAEEIRNILQVLSIPYEAKATSKQLVAQFEKSVGVVNKGDLRLFVVRDSIDTARIVTAAVAFSGPGIWGLIKGFMALDADMITIRGLTVYHNEETPGLGGDIATPGFCNKFIGKKIRNEVGGRGLKIRRTGAQGPSEIDGISGATLTCNKVEQILNSVIDKIDREARIGN